LFLGGSQGYSSDVAAGGLSNLARHLARQGFATLQLCYFDCPERPQFLNQILMDAHSQSLTLRRCRRIFEAGSENHLS